MRDPELGRWPRLLVTGTPVTGEQADEIIIRTTCWHLLGNDRWWESTVAAVAGIRFAEHGRVDLDSVAAFGRDHDVLDLTYLTNDRISSAWIGGPHGWCDWDGVVGCSTWNIGKRPSARTVTDEWALIAAAFPFLELTAQLVRDDGALDPHAAVQWTMRDGRVRAEPGPLPLVTPITEFDVDAAAWRIRFDPAYEQGVSEQRLRRALATTRAAAGRRRSGPHESPAHD